MPRVLRPVGHQERLSVVDHLDELRTRLLVCGAALVIAFAFCFWQNKPLLGLLNDPLPSSSKVAPNHLGGLTSDSVRASQSLAASAAAFKLLARSSTLSLQDRATVALAADELARAARSLPQSTPKKLPITIGVGEPFTTTLTVCAYFALLFTLPVLIYEAYAFVIPALNPKERRLALPIMLAAPLLFVIGVLFAYLIVLPPAIRFLQGYNSSNFDAFVQAKPLYSFEILTMAGIGLAFQMPLGLLGLQRAGIINGSTLTRNWRYAIVIIAVIAAAMPGADPVTTGLETAPLVVLFLASIVMLKIADRRDAKRALAELTQLQDDPATSPD